MNKEIEKLINDLEYDPQNIIKSDDKYYDYYYRLSCNNEEGLEKHGYQLNIIGIKYFDSTNEEIIKNYHRIYWNKNDLPISIIVFRNEIRVYNNFNCNITKALLFSSNSKNPKFKLEDFGNNSIISNVFWNQLSKVIKQSERVDFKLLHNLELTLNKITNYTNCTSGSAFDFITKCILIKYLEDRKVLSNKTFSKFKSNSFIDILDGNSIDDLVNLFNYLKNKFIGNFFNISQNDILKYPKAITYIADFFKGTDMDNGQLSLFPYDFSIIPIELISSIYEKFFDANSNKSFHKNAKKDSGSYYTPYFLVNFMVEREIIITNENYNNIQILDPACGSGVFLVGAFKKIVEYYKNNDIIINGKILLNILTKQIYGVDENEQALKIAEFSLYIALLDCMEPKDIEKNKLELQELTNNTLFGMSFFASKCLNLKNKFDIIIGNPPWKSKNGDHIIYCKERNFDLSDKQIAQAFVYRANDFIKENGTICFILPNSVFCNSNSKLFRNQFLFVDVIEEVLNLSSINNSLFSDASYPCSIVKFKSNSQNTRINFVNFMPNFFSKIMNILVFDFNNSYSIYKEMLREYDYLWNIAVSGSYYDFLTIKQIREINYTLDDMCQEFGLKQSQGFAKGKSTHIYNCYHDYNMLEENMLHYYIKRNSLKINKETLSLERIHDAEQYEKHNKVIFRRTLKVDSDTNYAAFYSDSLLYSNTYYCIYDPNDNTGNDLFYYLEAILNSKLYIYYQFHVSTAFKINPPEIRLDKVLEFPIIQYDANNDIVKTIVEFCKKIEMYNRQIETYRSSLINNISEIEALSDKINRLDFEINRLIFELYNFKDNEINIVNYTINCLLPITRHKALPLVTEDEMGEYCLEISRLFNSLLESENLKCVIKIYFENTIVKAIFSFVKRDSNIPVFKLYHSPKRTLSNQDYATLFVFKKIKEFGEDFFSLIKTRDSYNWQKFNAYSDFQDFIRDSFFES